LQCYSKQGAENAEPSQHRSRHSCVLTWRLCFSSRRCSSLQRLVSVQAPSRSHAAV